MEQEPDMTRRIHLLAIDPQNDFCDLPASRWPAAIEGLPAAQPALPVTGAHQDMLRLAAFIRKCGDSLTDITITLDSHHRLDIAHPGFWRQDDGMAVAPFTAITGAQVRAGTYLPRDPAALPRAIAYLDALEARGRYTLMVWPVHCEIGSWGHNVHGDLRAAYNDWEQQRQRTVAKVVKGTNPWTEHYSAVEAEVPDAQDSATQTNRALVDALDVADVIVIAGEAGSHCVKATTEHLADQLRGPLSRVVLLADAISPVTGFEAQQSAFFAAMQARGMRLSSTTQLAAELAA
jgi:nicotinamidase-related amidase